MNFIEMNRAFENIFSKMKKPDLILLLLLSIIFKVYVYDLALPWLGGDEFYYISRAALLAEGLLPYKDFAYSYTPGLLPILALPQYLFGTSYLMMRKITLFTDVLNVLLIFLISTRMYSRRAGWMAAIIYLTNYYSIKSSSTTMSEVYILFFILAGFYLIIIGKKPLLSGFCLAYSIYIKYWSILLWILPFIFLYLKKKARTVNILYLCLFGTMLFSTLLFVHEDFGDSLNYYSKVHDDDNVKLEGLQKRIRYVGSRILDYQPLFSIAILPLFLKLKSMGPINFLHVWLFSSAVFAFFPSFYPSHHLLLTLPPACILVGGYMSELSYRIRADYKAVSIILLISVYLMYSTADKYHKEQGHAAFSAERIINASNFLKNAVGDSDLIMQDYSFYSYLAGVKDNTRFGFHYGKGAFNTTQILGIINSTQPKYIVMTGRWAYPKKARKHIKKKYGLVDLGYKGHPQVYMTGYNRSFEKNVGMNGFI